METPGGGGFGMPQHRDIVMLANDLEDGRVLEFSARRDYGVDMVELALAKIK